MENYKVNQSFISSEDIKNILKDIREKCIEENIDLIVPLAKKGKYLFDEICPEQSLDIERKDDVIFVPVKNDRALFKLEDLSYLSDKNILLFDDSRKTGYHFKHIEQNLKSRIKKDSNGKIFTYSCFSLNDEKHNDNAHRTYIGLGDRKSYFSYCLEECSYFQRKLKANAIDLPMFELEVDDIETVKEIFCQYENGIDYYDTCTYIGNEKFDLGVLILKTLNLDTLLDGFLIASTCRMRYEVYGDKYRVKLIPLAIMNSIRKKELEDLYSRIFGCRSENLIKSYREIVYYFSYYIGFMIQEYLDTFGVDTKYLDNGIEQFDYKFNSFIKADFSRYNFTLIDRLNGFQYTYLDNEREIYGSYAENEIKEMIFNHIEESKKSNEEPFEGKSKFIEINKMIPLFKESKNLVISIINIIKNIENFSLSNELLISDDESKVYRGFLAGECSYFMLPYQDKVFYAGLKEYYDKTKDLDTYLKKYELFIEKFLLLLENEKLFNTELISASEFYFYANYYKDVDQYNFYDKIESKEYILNDKKYEYEQNRVRERMRFILQNDKFENNYE